MNIEKITPPSSPLKGDGYGGVATRGVAWNMLSILASLGNSFVAQLILGWLLSKDDFAQYALVVSLSMFVNSARNGRLQTLLVQEGGGFINRATAYYQFGLYFNIGIMLVLFLLSGIAAKVYNQPALIPLVSIIAVSVPLSTHLCILRSSLLVQMRFRLAAKLNLYTNCFQQAFTIVLAFLGAGAYSFVISSALAPLLHIALIWRHEPGWSKSSPLSLPFFRQTFKHTKWLMLSAVGGSLVLSGDYLVIGYLEPAETLAIYYFGYQLTWAFWRLFVVGSFNVLLATLSKLQSDIQRQRSAFIAMLKMLATLVTPCCLLLSLGAHIFLHVCWGGRWDQAVPVVEFLAPLLSLLLLSEVSRALLESRKEFKISTIFITVDAIGVMLSVTVGALIGGLYWIVGVLVLFRAIMSILRCFVAGVKIDLSPLVIVQSVLPGIAIPLIFFIVGSLVKVPFSDVLIGNIAGVGVYLLLLAFSWPWLFKDQVHLLLKMVRKRQGKL